MHKHSVLLIVGTRPELIKVAPIVHEFRRVGFTHFSVVNTAQHRELLDKYWSVFDIKADYTLNVIVPNQDLSSLTARAITQINELVNTFAAAGEKPQFILAQGDTTTVMAASMVAFYQNINFVHLEAGLRSYDLQQPFPEEFNRRVAGIVATHHLAPTAQSQDNLLREHVPQKQIAVVGNTVIDALNFIRNSGGFDKVNFSNNRVQRAVEEKTPLVLITCHRRENHNKNLQQIISAVSELATENPDHVFIWPVHANPNVKEPIYNSLLNELPNVILTEPLDYLELLKVMSQCRLCISDSGGIQEEAPSFHVPVLVMRDTTERPEAIQLGYSRLVGANKELIKESFYHFKPIFPAENSNPYGDGKAAARIANMLVEALKQ